MLLYLSDKSTEFLTDGSYDRETGIFTTPRGQEKCFVASDHEESPHYRVFTPDDLRQLLAACPGIKVLVTTRVTGKQVFLPLLSQEGPVNVLTGSQTDSATNTPAFKETSVRMQVLPERGDNPLKKLNFRYSGKPTPQSGVEVERKWKRADYQMPGAPKLVQITGTK